MASMLGFSASDQSFTHFPVAHCPIASTTYQGCVVVELVYAEGHTRTTREENAFYRFDKRGSVIFYSAVGSPVPIIYAHLPHDIADRVTKMTNAQLGRCIAETTVCRIVLREDKGWAEFASLFRDTDKHYTGQEMWKDAMNHLVAHIGALVLEWEESERDPKTGPKKEADTKVEAGAKVEAK